MLRSATSSGGSSSSASQSGREKPTLHRPGQPRRFGHGDFNLRKAVLDRHRLMTLIRSASLLTTLIILESFPIDAPCAPFDSSNNSCRSLNRTTPARLTPRQTPTEPTTKRRIPISHRTMATGKLGMALPPAVTNRHKARHRLRKRTAGEADRQGSTCTMTQMSTPYTRALLRHRTWTYRSQTRKVSPSPGRA